MNEIKVLCKDCKYFKEGKTSSSDLCIHPSSEEFPNEELA
jgi:hypothetical protein